MNLPETLKFRKLADNEVVEYHDLVVTATKSEKEPNINGCFLETYLEAGLAYFVSNDDNVNMDRPTVDEFMKHVRGSGDYSDVIGVYRPIPDASGTGAKP